MLEGIDRSRGLTASKDQRVCVAPAVPDAHQPIESTKRRVTKRSTSNGTRQSRCATPHHASIRVRHVHPINPELELIAERHIVDFRLEIHLTMNALVHAVQVIL